MKKIHAFATILVSFLLAFSANLRAEDTDLYVSNAANGDVPNVLFVLDNGANFSANANGTGCTAYTGTNEAPSLGSSTASSILQCALVNAINALPENAVNIGLVTANANNFGETLPPNTTPSDGGYHALCNASGVGGCVLRELARMNSTNKASLIKFIKGWQLNSSNGGSTADQFLIKVNSATQSAEMQEAWAYYNGKTGLSGTTYSPSKLATGCQRNFIIYVSNTEKDMDGSATNTAAINALSASQVGATVGQLNPITGQVKFVPSVCSGQSSMNLIAANSGSDEWARLMYQQDGGANGNEGQQNIISYSIAILGPENKCSTDAIGLMASIAQQGGGKSFRTSNVDDLTNALSAVLNEVQAVNSVFASASLPVSVNAQGTYLNQIYMGMFRPDASGSPRWLGNLKQYQLVYDANGSLVLGDANGNYAISSAGTGFITPTAVSFWTSKNTASVPDSTGGFFVNNLEGALLSPYDLPDGEVVEKGGVAQQIRKENLTATFAGASNTSSNPRRMYTYCPSGASCNPDLTHSSNDFSTANADIAATSFGNSPGISLTRLARSGTTVTGTTSGNHGLSAGAGVEIRGVTTDTAYDGFFTLTAASGNTFTFTLSRGEYPTNSTIDYTVAKSSGGGTALTGVSRVSTTATVTSASDLSTFTVGSNVLINGFDQAEYNGVFQVLTNSGSSLTYTVARNPPATATNTYTASLATLISRDIAGISTSGNGSNKVATVTTTAAHGFHVNQSVRLSGTGVAAYDGIAFTITSVPDSMNFTINPGNGGAAASKGTVTNDQASKTITALTRSSTTATAATSATNDWFANGDVVTITKTGGTAGNETAYEQLSAVISCTTPCTQFTYTVVTTPASPGSFTGTPTISVPTAVGNITANGITRSSGNTTAQATMTTSFGTFANGDVVTISPTSGAAPVSESAYVGTFTISCATTCATFTISGIRVTPITPVTDSNMMVYAGAMPPDRDTLIKWVRGQDNFGDEKGPASTSPTVTVRPSVHADVLHSRPIVINYGDSRGMVVYYGTNDGVFHAINGQQTGSIGSVPAGDELWGFVLPEHYGFMNRQRIAWPELKFPTTTLRSAQTKNYFVDGPTGSYQRLNADGTVNAAYLYLTMRRGGRFIYALDVTTPQSPRYLWKIDTSSPVSTSDATPGFSELGQTWSRPKMTLLQSSAYRTTPVLVFGAGYDPSEDSEPPGTDKMGRGVYIVNALTGELIWSASSSCSTVTPTATCLNVPGMTYAIPSDVTFVDQDYDGYTDKFYVGDLGGNIWRVDVSAADRANWTVTKIAALGCDTGVCSSGTTPRKFFFPPSVLVVGSAGATGSYDAISIMSGDREHPLKSTATGSSYQTADKFFMVKDTGTVVGTPSTNNLTRSSLFNATSTTWDGTGNGFYMSFATGEKGVNAPLSLNGVVYFATNTPVDPTANCAANLGKATAYAVSPFSGEATSNVVAGGGLAPSAVAGVVQITTTETVNGETVTTTKRESFCLGCGVSQVPGGGGNNPGCTNATANCAPPPQCRSFEDNCKSPVSIAGSLKRTYWYKK